MQCLKICYERGQRASELLTQERLDEAIEVLKWRKAAFVNFQFLDKSLLEEFRESYEQDEHMRNQAQRLRDQDLDLTRLIEENMAALNKSRSRIINARGKLKKFHSGRTLSSEFRYGI